MIRCDGASAQSRVVSKNLDPVFDELLSLRVEDATAPISIEVRDKDMVGSDLLRKSRARRGRFARRFYRYLVSTGSTRSDKTIIEVALF